ncbi:MAG: acetylornithine/succinylornithine family transaminase [Lachnospiraceae bacterium]|nr:acetylornithine/succinylornithine family transaminase [Lachnospiraceae bacterium]
MNITKRDDTFVMNTYRRFPVEIVSGKGSVAYDSEGKEYIDLGSGIGVTAFGYCDETWQKAVIAQLNKVQHTSNLYYTEPCGKLAELLCGKTGLKKVFFCNSGAEANECIIKAARKYAEDVRGIKEPVIVTLLNSFHGRTITTLAATGQEHYHEAFQPLTPGFIHVPANDAEAFRAVSENEKIAGILLECVQGEGGVVPLDPDYVKAVAEIAKEKDILLMIDEVQTGNGRTGQYFAYQNFGVAPDLVSTAKGLGGGLPLGAALFGEKVEKILGFGDHGSTFGGNPVCTAGAVSVVERIDDAFLAEVRRKSAHIFETFSGAKGVKSVSGQGLMIGILPERPAGDIVNECIGRGVLCLTAKDKVRLLPALNIPDDVLDRALAVLLDVLS